ncbi:hypothetical protein K440DRAFT_497530, partial [Wilcoxina mikolae CBS 423.85]
DADISSSFRMCVQSFRRLFSLLEESESGENFASRLRDETGRFRIWAENAGAHRTGRVSLDHRLREASNMKRMIIDLLEALDEDLQKGIAIVSGLDEMETEDMESWSSDSSISLQESADLVIASLPETDDNRATIHPVSNLEECFIDITHVITCLYDFSISIQNPAPRDRLQKCSNIDVSHFEYWDIMHVSHKFQDADDNLINRLGKANTRRRQLLMYHRNHHQKIADFEHHEYSIEEKPETVFTGISGQQTQTTVSTYVQRLRDPDPIDSRSETDQSRTSFATSTGGNQSLSVPSPPDEENSLNGEPFQCSYCFCVIKIDNRRSWMRHVFRDLRPYICTFNDCPRSNYLFESRTDWYQHETELHRREWHCKACEKTISSHSAFEKHLQELHPSLTRPEQLQTMINRCERPIQSAQACPLCPEELPPTRFQRHLGQHLQQVALFVLPRPEIEDD